MANNVPAPEAPSGGIPLKSVLMLAGCIAYFVMPADLIPDFIPGVGYADDMAALTAAFRAAKDIFSKAAKDKAMGKAAEIFGDKFDPELAAKTVSGAMAMSKKKK